MSLYSIDKIYLPSRIRRGRQSTCATWIVIGPDVRREFHRKRDAVAFVDEQQSAERQPQEQEGAT